MFQRSDGNGKTMTEVRPNQGESNANAHKRRLVVKLVQHGNCAAEVDVELICTSDEWCPCLSLSDAEKLDAVRVALRRGDVEGASALARVFELVPIAA
jgi:hypothetical protein